MRSTPWWPTWRPWNDEAPDRPYDGGSLMAIAATPRATIFRRPRAEHGFASWLTTVDHKRIGILYGVTSFAFFLIGGIEALLLRVQLAGPNGQVLTATEY